MLNQRGWPARKIEQQLTVFGLPRPQALKVRARSGSSMATVETASGGVKQGRG
jgi:hypothetical protein